MWAFSELPIIQAPMAGAQGAELCIAVCQSGGLGSIPAAMLTPATLREEFLRVRAGTQAPFNVNFFVHRTPEPAPEALTKWRERLAPYYAEFGLADDTASSVIRAPFDHALCEVVEAMRPPIVSFHFGLPEPDLLARVKATGASVFSCATTVAEARWLEARGVDAIIAQGREAGGHRGLFLSDDLDAQPGLFALLPQVVDAVARPRRRGRRDRRRSRRRRFVRARRRGGADRHGLSVDPSGEDVCVASRRARRSARRRDPTDEPVHADGRRAASSIVSCARSGR